MHIYNGMPATDLGEVSWQKSPTSSPEGNCVEMTPLSTGDVAVRNSRFPHGPALIYTHAEITHFIHGVKAGYFDNLL